MFVIESLNLASAYSEIDAEVLRVANVDEAAVALEDLTGWCYDDARDCLAEGDISWTDGDDLEVRARRVGSVAA